MPAYQRLSATQLPGCWKVSLKTYQDPASSSLPSVKTTARGEGRVNTADRVISALPSHTWGTVGPKPSPSPALTAEWKNKSEWRVWRLRGHNPLRIPRQTAPEPTLQGGLAHQETAPFPGVQPTSPPTGSLSQVAPGAGPKARPNPA